jgi:hypothetical protein
LLRRCRAPRLLLLQTGLAARRAREREVRTDDGGTAGAALGAHARHARR